MSDTQDGTQGRKAWQRPEVSRHELTAEELKRIDEADDPDSELLRVLRERQQRPQADSENAGGW